VQDEQVGISPPHSFTQQSESQPALPSHEQPALQQSPPTPPTVQLPPSPIEPHVWAQHVGVVQHVPLQSQRQPASPPPDELDDWPPVLPPPIEPPLEAPLVVEPPSLPPMPPMPPLVGAPLLLDEPASFSHVPPVQSAPPQQSPPCWHAEPWGLHAQSRPLHVPLQQSPSTLHAALNPAQTQDPLKLPDVAQTPWQQVELGETPSPVQPLCLNGTQQELAEPDCPWQSRPLQQSPGLKHWFPAPMHSQVPPASPWPASSVVQLELQQSPLPAQAPFVSLQAQKLSTQLPLQQSVPALQPLP